MRRREKRMKEVDEGKRVAEEKREEMDDDG